MSVCPRQIGRDLIVFERRYGTELFYYLSACLSKTIRRISNYVEETICLRVFVWDLCPARPSLTVDLVNCCLLMRTWHQVESCCLTWCGSLWLTPGSQSDLMLKDGLHSGLTVVFWNERFWSWSPALPWANPLGLKGDLLFRTHVPPLDGLAGTRVSANRGSTRLAGTRVPGYPFHLYRWQIMEWTWNFQDSLQADRVK